MLGIKLRKLRKGRGLSQEALAKKARLTRVYVNKLEAGRHDPSLSTLNALAKALGMRVTELLE
jgi:transcriptional regulator with XRE-family HTH domain